MSLGDTVEPPAFSNGSEFDIWQANWCDRCWHDREARKGNFESGCELIALGLAHQSVPQWVETLPAEGWVRCLKFTPDDGGGDEGPPVPHPVPPGQEVLFAPSAYDWTAEIAAEVSR